MDFKGQTHCWLSTFHASLCDAVAAFCGLSLCCCRVLPSPAESWRGSCGVFDVGWQRDHSVMSFPATFVLGPTMQPAEFNSTSLHFTSLMMLMLNFLLITRLASLASSFSLIFFCLSQSSLLSSYFLRTS